MQIPHFRDRGLDLSGFHPATNNVSIAPARFEIRNSKFTFRDVKWHPTDLAEDFSFFECLIFEPETDDEIKAFVYLPHPETKPEHEQPDDVLEIWASRKIEGIKYGSKLEILIPEDQIAIEV